MTKLDPHNSKRVFDLWLAKAKSGQLNGVNKANTEIIVRFVEDLRDGINIGVGSKKGERSHHTLLKNANRVMAVCRALQTMYGSEKSVASLSSAELLRLFAAMKRGELVGISGKPMMDLATMAKVFTAFWHWHQKVHRQEGIDIPDITTDLSKSNNRKPDWVYLTEDEYRKLADNCNPFYRALLWFMLDAGVRAPTELINVRVCDVQEENGETYLNVRHESSKTFGRRFKLMISAEIVTQHILSNNLQPGDSIFPINSATAAKYLKRKAKEVLGTAETKARGRYSDLTLYDLRHASVCFWLPRYKTRSALMYRFGWTKEDEIHYYTELLGMKDTIAADDMVVGVSISQIEKEFAKERRERQLLSEQLSSLQNTFEDFQKRVELLILSGAFGQNVRMLQPGLSTLCLDEGDSNKVIPKSEPVLRTSNTPKDKGESPNNANSVFSDMDNKTTEDRDNEPNTRPN